MNNRITVIGLGGTSVFMKVGHFHADGETLHADELYTEAGGKGFNQAIAAARLGCDVSFIQAAGDDSGALLCEETLVKNNVKPYVIKKRGQSTAFASILTDSNANNRVTVYRGAVLTEDDIDSAEPQISHSRFLIIQNEVPHNVNVRAVALAEKHGVDILYNPAPARQTDSEFLKKMFVVTPNEKEAEALDLSHCKNSVITLGSRGALLIQNDTKYPIAPYPVSPVDTTGAGDCFTAALAAALCRGMSLKKAAEYAAVAAALSTTKPHVIDSLPTENEVHSLLTRSLD